MPSPRASLQKTHSHHWEIPVMLAASAVLLICGLLFPAITLKELVFWKHTFSVLTGIQSLFAEGHHILGLIIILFSIIFPLFKLGVLFTVWFKSLGHEQRKSLLYWLGVLGKWSMLDVFVVAITIVITKISNFAKAQPEPGIYYFAVSVILAMLVTERMERLISSIQPNDSKPAQRNIRDIFQNN